MPVKPMATVRNDAPARMKAIMQDVFVAPMSPSAKVCLLSEPECQDRISARTTPTAAASVGDAIPA